MQQVAVKTLEGLVREITVIVPDTEIQQAVDKRLAQLSHTAKVKGFRPGKVPLNVVKLQYGESVRQEVISETLRKSLFKAINDQKLKVAGAPEITTIKAEPNQSLEYTATFEVYPEVDKFNFDGMEVEKRNAELKDQNIDKVLDDIRKEHMDWEEVSRPAALEDKVTIDFEGLVDNQPLQGGSAKGMDLVLGSQSFIPGFEQGLVGVKVGEQVKLNLEFPQEYHHKEVAGKQVEFTVILQKVLAPKLPEFNEELMKKLGNAERTVEQLRADIRKNMVMELNSTLQNHLKEQVFEQLLKFNPIATPKALVEEEINRLQEEFKNRLMQQMGQKKLPNFELPRDRFEEQAKKRVQLGLLLTEYIRKHDLKADDTKVRQRVEEMAAVYQHPEQIVNHYYENQELLSQIKALVLEDQAVETILTQAKVTEKTLSYEDAMKPAEPPKQHIESKA